MAFPGNGERIKQLDEGIQWFEKMKASSFATGILTESLLYSEVREGLNLLDRGLDCLKNGRYPSYGQCNEVGVIFCNIVDERKNRVSYYNEKGIMLLERVFSKEYSAGRNIIQNQPNGRQYLERVMTILNSAKAEQTSSANLDSSNSDILKAKIEIKDRKDEEKKMQNAKFMTAVKSLVLGIIFAGVAFFYFVHPFNFLHSLEMGMGIAARENTRQIFPVPAYAIAMASESGEGLFVILPHLFTSISMAFAPLLFGAILSALVFIKEKQTYRNKVGFVYAFSSLAIISNFFVNTFVAFWYRRPDGPFVSLPQDQFLVGSFGFIELSLPVFTLLLVGNLSFVLIFYMNKMEDRLGFLLSSTIAYIVLTLFCASLLAGNRGWTVGYTMNAMFGGGNFIQSFELPWLRFVVVGIFVAFISYALHALVVKISGGSLFASTGSANTPNTSSSYSGSYNRSRDDRLVRNIYNGLDSNSRKTLRDLGIK